MCIEENEDFLSTQIITYLGNKRSLLDFIEKAVEEILEHDHKVRMDIVDLFSGSGIVSRYFKKYSNHLITNDLEGYSYTLNECYLANKSDINITMLKRYYSKLQDGLKELKPGFITELYAPSNDNNIKAGERVFYTTRNAMYIDTQLK